MSAEEVVNSLKDIVHDIWNGILLFIAKFMPVSMFLGIVMAHLEQLIVKKESISSVTISVIASFVVVYFSTPAINHYLEDSKFSGVAMLTIGYFIQYVIKYITNQKRVNRWLIGAEKMIIQIIKNKFDNKK